LNHFGVLNFGFGGVTNSREFAQSFVGFDPQAAEWIPRLWVVLSID
jgi:hypothetical protein